MVINLKNSTVSATINSAGAQLSSFKRKDGFELLWQGDDNFWSGQAPVLFPMVGALRNGGAYIGGKWYKMHQHGFAKEMEFQIEHQDCNSVKLYIHSDEKTKLVYPFEFKFSIEFVLVENGIKNIFTVENTGNSLMPFAVGGHPAFNIPMGDDQSFEDYIIEFNQIENQLCPQVDLKECLIDYNETSYALENQRHIPLNHELFAVDALVFDGLNSSIVSLKNPKTGRAIEMTIDEFPMLGIWSTSNNGPFVALEPWTGCATTTDEGDDFEQKRHMTMLEPNAVKSFCFTVKYY